MTTDTPVDPTATTTVLTYLQQQLTKLGDRYTANLLGSLASSQSAGTLTSTAALKIVAALLAHEDQAAAHEAARERPGIWPSKLSPTRSTSCSDATTRCRYASRTHGYSRKVPPSRGGGSLTHSRDGGNGTRRVPSSVRTEPRDHHQPAHPTRRPLPDLRGQPDGL
jgi:hypothetical protein